MLGFDREVCKLGLREVGDIITSVPINQQTIASRTSGYWTSAVAPLL